MTRTGILILLQSVLAAGRLVNLSLLTVTHNAALALVVAAICEGVSVAVQQLGNQTIPAGAKQVIETVAAGGQMTPTQAVNTRTAAQEVLAKQ